MRLYLKEDVISLAALVKDERAENALILAVVKERMSVARSALALQKKEDAKSFMVEYNKEYEFQDPVSKMKIPTDILEIVMEKLATTHTLLRGPTAITRDLCNIALVSREFRLASQSGWRALADMPGYTKLTVSVDWVRVLTDPLSMQGPQLKEAAKALYIPVSGTKAEVALRILNELHVKTQVAPSARFSPNAIKFVFGERYCRLCQDILSIRSTLQRGSIEMQVLERELGIRERPDKIKAYLSDRYGCFEALVTHVREMVDRHRHEIQLVAAACRQEQRLASEARLEAQRLRQEAQRMRHENVSSDVLNGQPYCRCGNTSALRCIHHMCASCCILIIPGTVCVRHRIRSSR
jgi:hypothetical protein